MLKNEVAIVGAGISGLSLALFLHKQGSNISIYELRPADVIYDGAIVLSPNGLKALNALTPGLVDRICSKGYKFRSLTFRNRNLDYLDEYEVGNVEKYGFDSFRTYRQVILDELRALVKEAGIPVRYDCRFSHVVSDDGKTGETTFEFADGSQETANILIGADGIHSRVRQHLLPEIEPAWIGAAAVWCITDVSALKLPSPEYRQYLPFSVHGPTGAVQFWPQNVDGSEVLVAVQWRTHERSRTGWTELAADKAALRKVMEENGSVNGMTRAAIDSAPDESFSIWPFYTIPKLDSWYSDTRNVIIVGDAAHAVPPTGGQGANQSLEDVFTLSLLMCAVRDGKADWKAALAWWQQVRQGRVAKVVDIAEEIRRRRVPGWTGEGASTIDSSGLFDVDIPRMVEEWLGSQR